MYVKHLSPKQGVISYDNSGSVAQKVNYLEKEEKQFVQKSEQMANYLDRQERAAVADGQTINNDPKKLAQFNEKYKGVLKDDYKAFFSDSNLNIDKNKAVQYLDNAGLNVDEGKARFFSFALNFSKEESYIIEAKKNRREFLKELTDKAVDLYAKNFNYKNKAFTGKDVSYIAKIHDYRKFEDGTFNTDGQLHVHVAISRMAKDGKNELNFDTKYRDKFNKVNWYDSIQKLTFEKTGVPIKHHVKSFHYADIQKGSDIGNEGIFYGADGQAHSANSVQNIFSNNKKGLKNSDELFTKVIIKPQGRFVILLNDHNKRKQVVKQLAANYAAALKNKKGADDLLSFHSYKSVKGKKGLKGKPHIELYISNRSKDMKSSTAANPHNFDIPKFKELNNEYLAKVVKDKKHISAFHGQLFRLRKNTGVHIPYDEFSKMEFLDKDSDLFKRLKGLNDHIQKTGEVFDKNVAKDIINGDKDLQGRGVLKNDIGLDNFQLKKAGYQIEGVLKRMSGLAKMGSYDVQDNRRKKSKKKGKEQEQNNEIEM